MQRTGEREHRVLDRRRRLPRAPCTIPRPGAATCSTRERKGCWPRRSTPNALVVTGPPAPMVDSVITNLSGAAHFDVAAGTLAYIPGTIGEADRDLVWVTLDGRATAGPARPAHGPGLFTCRPTGLASSATTRSGRATSGLRTWSAARARASRTLPRTSGLPGRPMRSGSSSRAARRSAASIAAASAPGRSTSR